MIRILIPGEPVSKGRPRFGKGRTFTPKQTRNRESVIRWIIKQYYREDPMQCDVAVNLKFYSGDNRRRDLDNLIKLVTDAGNGLLYVDDSQIVKLSATVVRGSYEPETVLEVVEA